MAETGGTDEVQPGAALVQQLLSRAADPATASAQVARLLAASQAIATEEELHRSLVNVLEVARELVGASAGELRVLSADGSLEEEIVAGERGEVAHTLEVPVRARRVYYGTLRLDSDTPFDETDERIADSLAGLAATAIANARLYEEARLGQRWIAASEEINQRLLSGELADTDLSFIAGQVLALSSAVFVGLVLPGDEIDGFARSFGDAAANPALETDAAFGALAKAVRYTLSTDASPISIRTVEAAATAEIGLFGPTMIVPWGESAAAPVGAFVVARQPGTRPFSGVDRQSAERFARSVSIARELSTARNDRERVALSDERDRIARDLHDHVIQSLFAVGLGLQSLVGSATGQTGARIAAQVDAIDVTIRQIRQTIFQLSSPPTALAYSQKQRLNQLVRTTLEGEGIDSSLDFSGPVDTLIDSELGDEVSAVIREALSNVVRHAEASRVDISVAVSTTGVRVVVTDNGRGLGELAHRSGLDNLAARAKMRGGTLTIAARAPSGTTLDWAVPTRGAQ